MRGKLDRCTRNELNRVDQDEHYDALWVLRHSSAAREVFAKYQYNVAMTKDRKLDEMWDMVYFCEGLALLECLHIIARETIRRHRWAWCRLNPNRVLCPTGHEFERLADAFGYEKKPNEWHDETLVRTIDGWWQV